MRIAAAVALGIGVLVLQGCVSSTFNSLSNLGTGCTTGTSNVACTGATTNPAASVTPPLTPTTSTPTTNTTTNTTTITTGDTTIAIEAGSVVTPVGKPAVSTLSNNPLTMPGNLTPTQLQAQLTSLYATYQANPTTTAGQAALTQYNTLVSQMTASQQFYINTNTTSNSTWPSSKTQVYTDYGTCVGNGGADGLNPGSCFGSSTAAAVQGSPTGTGGTGLGGTFKEYRAYSQGQYDEELQVWTWNNSYATQYRDVTSGGGTTAAHQAWSFGGNYTVASAMPTSGTVQYVGQWTGTATTSNLVTPYNTINPAYTAPTGAGNTVSANNTWQVNGTSSLTANFGNATMTGTLTPVTWTGNNSAGGFTSINAAQGFTDTFHPTAANNCYNLVGTCGTNLTELNNYLNYSPFMSTNVLLSGVITTNTPAAITASPNLKPNQVMGQAFLDPNYLGWITSSGTNPMFAGFFGNVTTGTTGTGPQEITGNFAVSGTSTAPNGGNNAINNDKRGYLTMSGIFNGQIQ